MKKLVKMMAALVMVAGVVGFMGCKQATGGGDVSKPEAKPLQEGVKVLPDGTDGTFGTKGKYVEFGIWPQTKYSGDVKVLKPCEKGINAWEQSVCFTDGTDNYIKVTAAPEENNYEFDDGSKVEAKEYYFKLEPIQWRVLTNDYNGKKLLFAEKALAASCFYKDKTNRGTDNEPIYPNNYKESDIRTYLNKDFINKAFTPAEIAKIPVTVVDNSAASTTDAGNTLTQATDYACGNTTDKIFLLSEKEITTADYGFAAYNKTGTDSTRIRKTTDYARATGAWVWVGSGDDVNNSTFWLRSPDFNRSYYARKVSSDGGAGCGDYVYYSYVSVVPALSILF